MVTDTIKKIANAILDAGEGCQSGLVYVDPVEAAKAAIAVLSAEERSYNAGFNDGWEAANGEPPEAALSTDAEPAIMDDEDRTPTPAGFDDALWRKADEVHHAMALVARDQECVKIIYAALSTHNAEPVKTAPAVAVKALQEIAANPADDVRGIAKKALSTLSAQVQDVAGWQPIETAPRDGSEFQAWIKDYGWEPKARINLSTEAFEIWGRIDYDEEGWAVYPHMVPTHWMPLPASPASKHGDAE